MAQDSTEADMEILPYQKYSQAMSICNSLAMLASQCTMVVFVQRIAVLKNIETCWIKGQEAEVVYHEGSRIDLEGDVHGIVADDVTSVVGVKLEPDFVDQSLAKVLTDDSSDDTIVDEPFTGGADTDDDKNPVKVEGLSDGDYDVKKTRKSLPRSRRRAAGKKDTTNRRGRTKPQKRKAKDQGPLKCDVAKESVTSEDPEASSYKFLCLICKEVFETFSELKEHKTQDHGGLSCSDDSGTEESLKSETQKRRTGWEGTKYQCTTCERSFPSHLLLMLHLPNHAQHISKVLRKRFTPRGRVKNRGVQKPYRCPRCCVRFVHLSSLYLHAKLWHAAGSSSNTKRQKTPRRRGLRRDDRESMTSRSRMGRYHLRRLVDDGDVILIKEEPGYACSDNDDSYHGSPRLDNKSVSDLRLDTEDLDKALMNINELASDMVVLSNMRPFACEFCNATFRQKSILVNHRRRHTGEKPLECDQCDKRFTQHSMLRYHKRTRHTIERPSVCTYCGKEFEKSILLEYHLRKHTGGRPYACTQCNETFASSRKFEEHKRKWHTSEESKNEAEVSSPGDLGTRRSLRSKAAKDHTEDSPMKHQCTFCGQSFQYESLLKLHLPKHTGERPYHCEVCGKQFRRKSRYDGHVRSHTGETPYECKDCGKRFPQSANLSYHVKTRHATKGSCGSKFRNTPPNSEHRSHPINSKSSCDEVPRKSDDFQQEQKNQNETDEKDNIQTKEDPSNGCSDNNLRDQDSLPNNGSLDDSSARLGSKYISDASFEEENACKCSDCSKCFKDLADFESHMSGHSDERPFTCEFCNASFRQKSILVIHRRRHTGEKPLECDECKMRFLQHSTLRYHKRTRHTKEQPCVCTYCGKEFAQSILLEYHLRKHTGGRPFACLYCSETFASLSKFEEHRKQHPREETKPGELNFEMDNYRKLPESDNSFGNASEPKPQTSNPADDRPFACEFCDATFRQKSILVNHRRRHTGEKPYECEECKMRFKQHSALRYHKKTRHTVEQPSVCTYCGKQFPKLILLEYHLRKHTGGRPFACTQCSEMFPSLTKFEEHKRQNHAEGNSSAVTDQSSTMTKQKFTPDLVTDPSKYVRKHSCSICARSFHSKADLRRHTAVHTSEKPFMCTHCGVCFRLKASLEAHTRRHTGEKPYHCNDCGMQFRQQSTLKYHIRAQHTLEKPFLCLECGKMFRSSTMLKYHTRTHTGEKPFACDVCGNKFARPGQLKQHKKLHSIAMTYSCEECGKKFRLQTTLAKHRKIHLARRPYS